MTNPMRYASYLVLAGLLVALWFNLYWPWGLLFLFWVALSIRNGEAFLLTPVSRRREPALFWIIVALWASLSITMLVGDLAS